MSYSDWLALMIEFSQKTRFESKRVLWYLGKVFFAFIFLHKKWHNFSTEKVLTTQKLFLC